MNPVIRRSRLLLAAIAALCTLSACAGGSDELLQVGDDVSVTQQELVDFASAQGDGTPLTALSSDAVRGFFRNIVIGTAIADQLAEEGVVPSDGQLSEWRNSLAETSDGLNADDNLVVVLSRSEWAFGAQDAYGFPDNYSAAGRALIAEIDDVEVSSRVGVWDSEAAEILPPILAGR
jgi:hypothetical protein